MKVGLSSCPSVQRRLWVLALIMTGATLLVQLLLPAQWQLHCRFHSMTGLPCPGCGASRCGELLMNGHFGEAARMQPFCFGATVLLLPLLAYSVPALLLNWPLPRIRMESRRGRTWLVAGLAILILTNWAYLIFQHI